MSEDAVLEKLTGIFREVFLDDTLVATLEMTAADAERWDSLSHIDMIMMVEQTFRIRIPTRDVTGMKNVGDLVRVIERETAR